MRTIAAAALILALSAVSVLAQDSIRKTDGTMVDGEIIEMTYNSVRVRQPMGEQTIDQTVEARDVADVQLGGRENYPYALRKGQRAMEDEDFDAAIKFFDSVINESRRMMASDVAKQYAYWHRCEAVAKKGDRRATLKAILDFRRAYPETYFLRNTFEMQYELARAAGDVKEMGRALDAYKAQAGKLRDQVSRRQWTKEAEVKKAEYYEFRGESSQALRIYAKYGRDSIVGDLARLGELRCLSTLGKFGAIRAKAATIVSEATNAQKAVPRKPYNLRLLMAAYNGLGDCEMQDGRTKNALMKFLRVVVDVGPSYGILCAEHEAGVGKAAIAAAKYASELDDKVKAETYIDRSESLMNDLVNSYGDGSQWVPKIKAAVKAAKAKK
ncbi:MAG: hypothetical protein ACYTAF_00400 [Planctomycetota bacterium]|jgi:tetratricopeptide (TPR) repeat protein